MKQEWIFSKPGWPPDEFVCIRCGLCCLNKTEPDNWKKVGEYTAAEQKKLLAERKKYPVCEKKCCRMLVFRPEDGGLSSCLIQLIYGLEKKPLVCRKHPEHLPEILCDQYSQYEIEGFYIDNDDGFLKVRTRDGKSHNIISVKE